MSSNPYYGVTIYWQTRDAYGWLVVCVAATCSFTQNPLQEL